MQQVGVEDYQGYQDVLEADPGEFAALFNTILINVTSLLRDRDAWDFLAAAVLPTLLQSKATGDPIRVWSAGCATGEEAYSLAVLLAEALGEDRFRHQVKIYATDADLDALAQARHGRFAEGDLVRAFGDQRTRRFFDVEGGAGTFRNELRRVLIFGRHDLVQDPPISRIDLLVCRNTLMYFTADVQRQILANFHFALNHGGFLFLGQSEALVTHLDLFQVTDQRRHIFRKDSDRGTGHLLPLGAFGDEADGPGLDAGLLARSAVEQSPTAQLIMDTRGNVVGANLQARRAFSVGFAELGQPLKDTGLSLGSSELRALVEQAVSDRRPIGVADVTQLGQREPATFDVVVYPLEMHASAAVSFFDVSRFRSLRADLERSQHELEAAYEELQSTVEELETTNEELETTNEELHSTNEELETMNEELQSTNEELETMNEELHSTNEELETMNEALRLRSAEVDDLNTLLQSMLASLGRAVVVLSPDMEVRAWNRHAEDLWGLRADEVTEQHFLSLDIGFPVESLGPAIRACLAGRVEEERVIRAAVNRRGRPIECTVTVSRLMADGTVRGAILLMDAMPTGEPGAYLDD